MIERDANFKSVTFGRARKQRDCPNDRSCDSSKDVPGGRLRESAGESVAHLIRHRMRRIDPDNEQTYSDD
jgi:hypothetical protein